MPSNIDWRLLALLTALGWGIQGPLAKAAVSDVGWRAAFVTVFFGFLIVSGAVYLTAPIEPLGYGYLIALVSGIVGGLGSWAFYRALDDVELSVLIPVTAQYVLVTAIIGILFMHEKVTPTRIVGIVLSVIAVILLSLPAKNG